MPTLRPGPDTPGSAATRGLHRTAGLLRNGHRPCERTHRARDHAPTAAGTRHAGPAAPRRAEAGRRRTGPRRPAPDGRPGSRHAIGSGRREAPRVTSKKRAPPNVRPVGGGPVRVVQAPSGLPDPELPTREIQKLTTSRCEKWLRPRRQRLEDNRHRRFLRQRLLRHDLAEHPRDLIPRPTRILGGTSARTGDSRPSAAPGPRQPRPGTTPAHALGCIAERPTPSRFRTGFSEGAP